MAKVNFSPRLARLLFIRGLCRAIPPLAVLWAIYDWSLIRAGYAAAFGLLTFNYVIVYILVWVAPHLLNGPWRIRPWQTFVLLANALLLPIVFYREFEALPWGFVAITAAMVAALYVSTAIFFHLQDRLPMASVFTARRGGMLAGQSRPTHPSGDHNYKNEIQTDQQPGGTAQIPIRGRLQGHPGDPFPGSEVPEGRQDP